MDTFSSYLLPDVSLYSSRQIVLVCVSLVGWVYDNAFAWPKQRQKNVGDGMSCWMTMYLELTALLECHVADFAWFEGFERFYLKHTV